MASIPGATSLLHLQSVRFLPAICNIKCRVSANGSEFKEKLKLSYVCVNWNSLKPSKSIQWRVLCSSENSDENHVKDEVVDMESGAADSGKSVTRLEDSIATLKPVLHLMKRHVGTNFAIGLCVAVTVLVFAIRGYLIRKARSNYHGSVADLVKRGQLRSDRRGISKPLKYDDPFNNPLVKVSKSNSSVEMCGKTYRLAPVTLTKEEQSNHQKRRSRAYQWKRPTVFLKEGDSIPPDVDPDTVRWIPANHPFATTVNDIDEDLAQNNVYQNMGSHSVFKPSMKHYKENLKPFKMHRARIDDIYFLNNRNDLMDQKLNKLVIDPSAARDFERSFKPSSRSQEDDQNLKLIKALTLAVPDQIGTTLLLKQTSR
ncbi:hypothetical protein Syun_005649 [Stephania yunnanensis]|uniref:Protein MULTIPLE CHLOROPLAST DIVISION SITE 1 n=1 Tax=Stephania yunnanensis TaxID=152371 RepID=A0AAP0L6M1_9MAGN